MYHSLNKNIRVKDFQHYGNEYNDNYFTDMLLYGINYCMINVGWKMSFDKQMSQ